MLSSATQLLRLVISGDAKGGVDALEKVHKQTEKTKDELSNFDKVTKYSTGAVVAMGAVIGLATKTTIAYGEAIDSVTDITNLGAESASRLVGQWQGFGVSAEKGASAVKFFERNLDAARRGSDEMVETFGRLGISLSDLQTLSDEDLLSKTRDGLAGTQDTGEQAAIALKLLGKAGTELSDWYAAAPEDMERVNEQLEKMGLVWGDKELKTWQDVIDAQREMKIAWMGVQISIADNVLPYLPPLLEGFGKLLQVIGPLAPVLVPATAALAVFVGVVKTVLIAQQAATAVRGLYAVIGGTQALSAAATGFRVLTTNIGLMTAAGGVSIGMLGALGIAIAASTAAVIGAVWAWNEWQKAIDQANAAYDNAMATLEKNKGKLSPEFYEQKKREIEEDKYEKPWYMFWAPTFASGGDFVTSGPQAIIVGDNPGGREHVQVTPLNGGRTPSQGSRSGMTLEMHFHGPIMGGRAGVREFMQLAGEEAELAMGGLV